MADALDKKIQTLLEAADNLEWATGVEVQGGHRTRAFKLQHQQKCRFWCNAVRAAIDAVRNHKGGNNGKER